MALAASPVSRRPDECPPSSSNPEWAPHEAVWIGFPSDPDLWLGDLKSAEREVAAFAAALHAEGRGEIVRLVAAHDDAADAARSLAPFAEVIVEAFGDIWLRDTGPIVMGRGKDRRAQAFGFNGWGGKYDLPGDEDIGERLARSAGLPLSKADWILEGGAIDGDGSGTVITTEQCLLNPNRNLLERDAIERRLKRDLGFTNVVGWDLACINDHTDGHVDNLARFVAPGRVAIPTSARTTPTQPSFETPLAGCTRAGSISSPCLHPGVSTVRMATYPCELHELLHRQ